MAIRDWDAAFEAIPLATELVSLGDDRIRDLKDTLRAILETEIDIGLIGGYTDTGRLLAGAARTFFVAAAPAALGQNDKQADATLDDGRIWLDTDDSQPYVRDQSITTDVANNYLGAAAGWVSLWPRTVASSDDATTANETAAVNDTREDVTGLTLTVDCPDDGRSYEIVVVAHMRYAVTSGGFLGLWLQQNIDAAGATDVDETLVNHAGGNTGLGSTTLTYVQTAPANGSSYVYTVQFATNPIASVWMNPTVANAAFNHALVDFAGTTSTSRMTAELRPRYGTGDY